MTGPALDEGGHRSPEPGEGGGACKKEQVWASRKRTVEAGLRTIGVWVDAGIKLPLLQMQKINFFCTCDTVAGRLLAAMIFGVI